MKTIEELSLEAFAPFGQFAAMLNPQALKIGTPPIEFFRDRVLADMGGATPSFSVCRVEPRPLQIDVSEYHSKTSEVLLPLDGDVLMHVGPATPPHVGAPVADFRVFRVPQGTLIALRPGVWHHAPFTLSEKAVNVLVVLPERTYANDCVVETLEPIPIG